MQPVYRAPEFNMSPFVCPHCAVAAKQEWRQRLAGLPEDDGETLQFPGFQVAQCHHCGKPSIWQHERRAGEDGEWVMAYPARVDAPAPAANMPDAVYRVYTEARAISSDSPRASCALLRLAVEQLLDHLGADGHSLNDKVGWLVRQGIARNIQMALDAVRVSGNKAVHPLEIVEDDAREVANLLFRLVNYVVETLVTGREDIQRAYDRLPDKARSAINRRDDVA